MGYFDRNDWTQVAGREVEYVTRAGDGMVHLHLTGNVVATLELEGDCCSRSYFTDLAQFDELVGATITQVEERDEPSRDGLPTGDPVEYVDAISWHFLVVVTNKGHVTIDWRNDSNGYYDGTINLRVA